MNNVVTNAPMDLPLKLADHAAQQTDRWMLIFVMMGVFAGAVWIFKWLITRAEKSSAQGEERLDRLTKLLETLFITSNSTAEKVSAVVACNTAHYGEIADQIRENNDRLRKVDVTLERACLIIDRHIKP